MMTASAKQHAVRCRWVTPTLFLDAPYWADAEGSPWACIRDDEPRPLATTAECSACRRFQATPPSASLVRAERSAFFG